MQLSLLKKELSIPSLLTVSKLSYLVRMKLEGVPAFRNIHVVGEISEAVYKENLYLTLKDERSSIKCVFFNPHTAFDVEIGLQVVVFGSISSYGSSVELVITDMIPVGEGAQALRLKQLKAKLRKEGLFDRKKSLPFLPQTIGLITAEESAAYGDVLKAIRHRFPHIHLMVRHSRVQGNEAVEDMIRAIRDLDSRKPGLILITRGGGGNTDLEVFDDEALARAISESKTPVVTAVGHDRDVHVADLVADAYFSTPTGAIEGILPSAAEYLERLSGLKKDLAVGVQRYVEDERKQKMIRILYIVIGVLIAAIIMVVILWT